MPLRHTAQGWVDGEGKPVKTTLISFEIKIRDKEGRLKGSLSAEDPEGIETGIDPETGLPYIKADKVESRGPERPRGGFFGRLLGRGKER